MSLNNKNVTNRLVKKAFSDLPKHPTSFIYTADLMAGNLNLSRFAPTDFRAEEEILRSNNDKCANPGPSTWAMSAAAAEILS